MMPPDIRKLFERINALGERLLPHDSADGVSDVKAVLAEMAEIEAEIAALSSRVVDDAGPSE